MIVAGNTHEGTQLLRTPPLQPNESLWGYMTRVAEANGYEHTNWLSELTGAPKIFSVSEENVAALARMVGAEQETLARLLYSRTDRGMKSFAGGRVPGSLIKFNTARVCPYCLRANGIRRVEWDLSLVSCCPLHGCVLIDRCLECYTSLSWKTARVHYCGLRGCGADLRAARPREAGEATVQLTALLIRAAGLQSDYTGIYDGRFKALEDLGILALTKLIMFLGGHAIGRARGSGAWLSARLGAGEMHRLVSESAGIIDRWPSGYFDLLDGIRDRKCALEGRTGLGHEFGSFYETLSKRFRGPEFGFLMEATAEYFETRWTGGFLSTKNKLIQPAQENRAAWLTRAKAAKRLGVRPQTLDRIIGEGNLAGQSRSMGNRDLVLVNRKSLEAYEEKEKDQLTFEEARKLLGVCERSMRQLIDRGLVKPMRQKPLNRSRSQLFSKKRLQRFLSDMSKVRRKSRQNGVPLDRALRRLTAVGMEIADLVTEVQGGRLSVVDIDEKKQGLKSLLLDEAQIHRLIQTRTVPERGKMTIPELARKLGVKQEVAYSLIKNRHIKASPEKLGTRNIRLVNQAALDRFLREYVSAAELAASRKITPNRVIASLAEKGIHPAIGPNVDGCRQVFYKRSDVRGCRLKAA